MKTLKTSPRWTDHLLININWLGLSSIIQSTTPLITPLLVEQFVGQTSKAGAFGTIRLWSLMVALLVQALAGLLSDQCTSRWGRRRPFILAGSLASMLVLILIGMSAQLTGETGFWTLFALVILLNVASNNTQAAQQALIPDLVPPEQRGIASGVKVIFETPLPVILVSLSVAPLISHGNLWGGILIVLAVVFLCALLTMKIHETPIDKPEHPADWKSFFRLVLMAGAFMVGILAAGWLVRQIDARLILGQDGDQYMALLGGAGLLAMLLAAGLGVWLSIRIAIGREGKIAPGFTFWVINRLAFLIGITNIASFAVYFLQARIGYQHEQAAQPASYLAVVVGAAILLAALPGGWLTQRLGSRRMAALGGFLAFLGTLLCLVVPNINWIFAGGFFIGLGAGLFYPANWALGVSIVPKEHAGLYMGISNLAGAGAGAIGAYIGGPIADSVTHHIATPVGAGYVVLFAIYGIAFLLSSFALIGIRKKGSNEL